jgi:hypothetical protein
MELTNAAISATTPRSRDGGYSFDAGLVIAQFCDIKRAACPTEPSRSSSRTPSARQSGKIISRLEAGATRSSASKMALSQKQAGVHAVHHERPFFSSLVKYMTSGPVYVAALQRDNAIRHLRKVMARLTREGRGGNDPGLWRIDRAGTRSTAPTRTRTRTSGIAFSSRGVGTAVSHSSLCSLLSVGKIATTGVTETLLH